MNEENMKDVKLLEAQVLHLQDEVAALQHQKDDSRHTAFDFSGRMQNTLWYLCGPMGRGGVRDNMVSRLKEEVEEMMKDLHQQTQMNTISLSSCSVNTIQNSSSRRLQQLCVSGHCLELEFQVEFQLSEAKNASKTGRISDLNVMMAISLLQNFSCLWSRMEENNDLLLFFRTLRTFSERHNDRHRTFQHFQEKYPSIVSLPQGSRSEVMNLHHPKLPGCIFLVHWTVEVDKDGSVSPTIKLLTKIPERALQLFSSLPVGGAVEAFHCLLRIVGPEAAVEAVIRAINGSYKT
ncbi:centromere protein P isoform X2 [Sphaeramia orbicularis]|uniref:centromere protein P isoform X2 n=1 Tax=Sphaeramia orbicularis TaxID=375764 RepID=UPI0011809947|nr:centromere protein P isoform X2 [Sphaeramia orbicularis]